jgi:hypothetical protein
MPAAGLRAYLGGSRSAHPFMLRSGRICTEANEPKDYVNERGLRATFVGATGRKTGGSRWCRCTSRDRRTDTISAARNR